MCFERRLLKLIGQNEFMYNPDHPDYNTIRKRKKCWDAIAKELETDVNHCKTKWFSLRGTYRKLLYKIKSGGGKINNRRKWKYYDDIAFINKFECMPPLIGYQPEEWRSSDEDEQNKRPRYFEYRMIELIREHEVIYNPEHSLYDDVDERNYAWQKISEELNVDKNALKLKWHSLRSAYAKILRKVESRGGLANYKRRWHYFDYMTFIIPFIGGKCQSDSRGESNSAMITTNDDVSFRGDSPNIKTSNFADDEDEDVQKAPIIKRDWLSSTSTVDDVHSFEEENFDDPDLVKEEVDEENEEEGVGDEALDEEEMGLEGEVEDEEEMENSDYMMFKSHTKSKTEGNNKSQRCVKQLTTIRDVAGAAGPCSKYFSLLGAKIDETAVPKEVRFLLEKQVTDLVYEVLAEYSLEVVEI